MSEQTKSVRGESDAIVRQYDYGEEETLVADVGHGRGQVDVVDGTAIVVVDDQQYEFEVPVDASSGIMNNGIVTIEVER